jgi:hypothetical protein
VEKVVGLLEPLQHVGVLQVRDVLDSGPPRWLEPKAAHERVVLFPML